VQDIKAREVCIVKRSDGSWKYGTLRQWYVVGREVSSFQSESCVRVLTPWLTLAI
jgi:hypothetical protein